ncbi:MAG: tRNA (adenosine(37)-N6)-dimethylallyltransferase MiaA [Rhodobacteraceae bacterium]|nr:tRNA (adenosine(37)-N6)-dimethylallyltransferase MiaA [Paracoccaceae bacterium]MBL6641010.1 tRNA (adenosine(37)-N6)-dimethylallyltransferase MiaA [Paracoccaceae bacterium]MBL6676899.1 tRNA (adenosine(37)-N6)-dimethylallyltransferase MiaA [Paracoccaceae bacterium]MBL6789838.1 tRNA (adenosine(37)-N6)-dimethylallyltransferase MiaA [Paracoccaceae bacterium]MBL6859928.1 tRNA (adenosine(37)-N6)-dimethylallyltransferase MiaA [Paracoccaceae bacterium]
MNKFALSDIAKHADTCPILIAGPTASGKSALAMEIAERFGGAILNADAFQIYSNWRVLTARPSKVDEDEAPHFLYGHIAPDAAYSVGHWLAEITPLLNASPRPIITGGTGLYFQALTKGLANIPPIPPEIRKAAQKEISKKGFEALISGLDAATKSQIDCKNPMRVQRAWEVQKATGRSIAVWQASTPKPLLPVARCITLLCDVDKDWLNRRIQNRFHKMIEEGALDEAAANLPSWSANLPASRAIGARQLIAHLRGEMPLSKAIEEATIATRQYAKRQRTWFRSKMDHWSKCDPRRL